MFLVNVSFNVWGKYCRKYKMYKVNNCNYGMLLIFLLDVYWIKLNLVFVRGNFIM